MSTPPPQDRAALGRERLAARARRVALIRRGVAAGTLSAFALAWGVIAYVGPMGQTQTTAATSTTTTTTESSSTASTFDPGFATGSDDGSSSSATTDEGSAASKSTGVQSADTPATVTTRQS
jgi:hypothetical protein